MAFSPVRPSEGETPLRAEALRKTLQPHILGHSGLIGRQNFRAILLQSGRAELTGSGEPLRLQAPAMLWTPWTEAMRLTIAPGSAGRHLLTGPAVLSLALRHNANAAELGHMIERRYVVDLSDDPTCADTSVCRPPPVEICGDGIDNDDNGLMQETREAGAMSSNLIEAHLAVLLITLYRRLRAAHADLSFVSGVVPLASRFIAAVETHLHERWTVERYCTSLDVTRDQLHAACLRSYQRTPGLLIRGDPRRLLRRLRQNAPRGPDHGGGAASARTIDAHRRSDRPAARLFRQPAIQPLFSQF